jgi:hypothetical protein
VNRTVSTTRSQGFWSTHTSLTNAVWTGVDLPAGATAVAGSPDAVLCTTSEIAAVAKPGASQLMGGFWASVSKLSTGKGERGQRFSISPLEQPRMQMLQQYLAAVLNVHMFGSGSGAMLAAARRAYCGTDVNAIQAQTGILEAFNSGGDCQPFTPEWPATPKDSQKQADITFWDVTLH